MTVSKHKQPRLSRSAKALYKTTVLPRALARYVGVFMGTDNPFMPGDTFVRFAPWGLSVPNSRDVRVTAGSCGRIRWYKGRSFKVYEVHRVTPRTVTCVLVKTVDVYAKWVQSWFSYEGFLSRVEVFSEEGGLIPDAIEALFVFEHDELERAKLWQLHFRKTDATAMREYAQLDLKTAVKLSWPGKIRHEDDDERGSHGHLVAFK